MTRGEEVREEAEKLIEAELLVYPADTIRMLLSQGYIIISPEGEQLELEPAP